MFQDDSEKKKPRTTTNPEFEGCNRYIPRQVDAEESIRYMESQAYSDVYKDEPVWKPYRRNAKRSFYPPIRRTCIRNGVVTTASPCPVCRDDYLVLDYRNVKLLKQFVSVITGKPIRIRQVGLCRKQYRKLQLELAKAQDHGYMHKYFPLRKYDYNYYYSLVNGDGRSSESDQAVLENTTDSVQESSEASKEQQQQQPQQS